jgi:myo-inositol-1-phosphate synthase
MELLRDSDVNVALVGVGNCAASLVQGVEYYRDDPGRPGLTNPVLAGYPINAVRFVSAFDVHEGKIGRDLSEAIWVAPNNALKFAGVPPLGVTVCGGVLGDGVGTNCLPHIPIKGLGTVESVASELVATKTHILVSFLPTGSQQASEAYATAALRAGCAFINCMPAVIARSEAWVRKFEAAGIPLLGDDLKSQFGATLLHHALMGTLSRNGVAIRSTSQVVRGGNMDFLNLQDPDRVKTKKATKVHGFGGTALPAKNVCFGAEYVPALKDRKTAIIRIDGEAFGGTPLEVELKMEVEDSPSAAGNVLDAVRFMKLAMDRREGGVQNAVANLLMKAPPKQMPETDALVALDEWLQHDRQVG